MIHDRAVLSNRTTVENNTRNVKMRFKILKEEVFGIHTPWVLGLGESPPDDLDGGDASWVFTFWLLLLGKISPPTTLFTLSIMSLSLSFSARRVSISDSKLAVAPLLS